MHGCSLINKMKGILWGTLLQCQNIVYIMSIFPNQCQRGRMQLSSSFSGSKIKLSVFNLVSDNLCLNIPSWLPLNIPLKSPFCLGYQVLSLHEIPNSTLNWVTTDCWKRSFLFQNEFLHIITWHISANLPSYVILLGTKTYKSNAAVTRVGGGEKKEILC